MADLTITAANVVASAGAKKVNGVAGETITAGQLVYKDPTTGKYLKADADSATVAARTPSALALHGASLNQPLTVQTSGDVTIGATLTAGLAYYASGTAGGICPVADLTTGKYVTLVGVAKSPSVLALNIQPTGVAN